MSSLRRSLARYIAARDPGRARLVNAVAISSGVLASVLIGWLIVRSLHVQPGMLSLSVFLSMQAGNMVKDKFAASRLLTTALLLPAALAAVLLAVAAAGSGARLLAMIGFVAMTGLAIWLRRFGPRAAALGSIAFISYFFTLFMKPEGGELAPFLLLVCGAILPQLVVRAALLVHRPRREIRVLLNELRAASQALMHAAARVEHPAKLRMLLARADAVGQAIRQWQDRNPAQWYIDCDAETFESRVLDARVDIEEASMELVRSHASTAEDPGVAQALARLRVVLSGHTGAAEVAASVQWAEQIVNPVAETRQTRMGSAAGVSAAEYLVARAVLTQARLRFIDLAHGRAHSGASVRSPKPVQRIAPPRARRTHWLAWRDWSLSTRMTLQAMIAATFASVVGEMISATRWYWAVMTAFVIFIGTSSRGSILTRAMRRIAGTVIGILVGLLAVYFVGDASWALAAIALLAVFGMLYFGPINYIYTSLFVTAMLVAIYRMLGVLNFQLLGLRVAETLAGAVIGVLSAYLVLSASSRPALHAQAASYFGALDTLLQRLDIALAGKGAADHAMQALNALESQQSVVDQTVAGMSASFVFRATRHESEFVHLMYVVTRAAARLTQSVRMLACDAQQPDPPHEAIRAVSDALRTVRASAAETRDALLGARAADHAARAEAGVLAELQTAALTPGSPSESAIKALARCNWALQKAALLEDARRFSARPRTARDAAALR